MTMSKRVVQNLERAADRAHAVGDQDRARRLQDQANKVKSADNRSGRKS